MTKITERVKRLIRQAAQSGARKVDIARGFGLTRQTVWRILGAEKPRR